LQEPVAMEDKSIQYVFINQICEFVFERALFRFPEGLGSGHLQHWYHITLHYITCHPLLIRRYSVAIIISKGRSAPPYYCNNTLYTIINTVHYTTDRLDGRLCIIYCASICLCTPGSLRSFF
jgi:hypothetical protein